MPNTRDWRRDRRMWIALLEKQSDVPLHVWNETIRERRFDDEGALRGWLTARHIKGYARQLLVMEHFGYPDYLRSSADQLIARQYAGCPELRAVYDRIVAAACACGTVVVQARKTYVSLVTPRRTFARIQRSTRTRVDVGLRLDGQQPEGRLRPSRLHETMRLQFSVSSPKEVDAEVKRWLRRAYEYNT